MGPEMHRRLGARRARKTRAAGGGPRSSGAGQDGEALSSGGGCGSHNLPGIASRLRSGSYEGAREPEQGTVRAGKPVGRSEERAAGRRRQCGDRPRKRGRAVNGRHIAFPLVPVRSGRMGRFEVGPRAGSPGAPASGRNKRSTLTEDKWTCNSGCD
ncbi:cell cycle regulator of non-homologous end joining isoform X2 [Callithrix jacchus]